MMAVSGREKESYAVPVKFPIITSRQKRRKQESERRVGETRQIRLSNETNENDHDDASREVRIARASTCGEFFTTHPFS